MLTRIVNRSTSVEDLAPAMNRRGQTKRAVSQVAALLATFGLFVNECKHSSGEIGLEYTYGRGRDAKVVACWDMEESLHVVDKNALSGEELAVIHSHSQLISTILGKV